MITKYSVDMFQRSDKIPWIYSHAELTKSLVFRVSEKIAAIFELRSGNKKIINIKHGVDYAFLFLAIAVQCLRIYGINKLTTLEAAGKGKIEKYLHVSA